MQSRTSLSFPEQRRQFERSCVVHERAKLTFRGVESDDVYNCSMRHEVDGLKIIGARPCYPEGPAKRPDLVDVAFTSGVVMRSDGKVDLYSGIGDAEQRRIVIEYPFEGHGRTVANVSF